MTIAFRVCPGLPVLVLSLFAGYAAAQPVQDGDRADWVAKRIQEWQPTKDERRIDEIGWAKDIREALGLAKQHGRPVFLFTYDGVSLTADRC
jgi:hypothetical protein